MSLILAIILLAAPASAAAERVFFYSSEEHSQVRLAARSTARYFSLLHLFDELPSIQPLSGVEGPLAGTPSAPAIVFSTLSALPSDKAAELGDCAAGPRRGASSEAYAICRSPSGALVSVLSTSPSGVLYGATALLERLGLRFSLAAPILPPLGEVTRRGGLSSALAPGARLEADPVFDMRGIQPFHDFYEGADTWTADGWALVAEQIAMMKGNSLAIHTYPYSGSLSTGTNEPAVWLGPAKYVNEDGSVTAAYPTSWASTSRAEWGDVGMSSSEFFAGAASIFDFECSGHPVQAGNASLCPWPTSPEASVDLFNAVGAMWKQQFPYWKSIGVKSIIGTESPMPLPPYGQSRPTLNLYYSAQRSDHFATTTQCAQCEGAGYVLLGTMGALFSDAGAAPGLIAMDTYYNGQTMDNILLPAGAPVPPGYSFVRTEGYGSPSASGEATLALLQYSKTIQGAHVDHWAVAGANWSSAAAAQGYTPSGPLAYILMEGDPTPTSLEYFEGAFTRLKNLLGDSLDTYWVWTPESFEWSRVSINDPKIQQVKSDRESNTICVCVSVPPVSLFSLFFFYSILPPLPSVAIVLAAQAARDSVGATFNLATCGWVVGPLGARWYLDTVLPDNWAISSIDMQVGNTPVDVAYANITRHKKWVIPWLEDDPGLTSLQLWVNRTLEHNAQAQGYGVNGLLNIHWRTRSVSPQAEASHAYAWNASLQSVDFWSAWAAANFGPSAAPGAAAVFTGLDSYSCPRPVDWIGGPGGWNPGDCAPLSAGTYDFPDTLFALRPLLLGDITAGRADHATLERFDYWLTTLRYTRAIARTTCAWAAYDGVFSSISKMPAGPARQAAAQSQGYTAWAALLGNATVCQWDLLSSASTLGEWGTVVNTQSHTILPRFLGAASQAALAALAGEAALPPALVPTLEFDAGRVPLLRVPVARTSLAAGESLNVRAFLVANGAYAQRGATKLTLLVAPLGSTSYTSYNMTPAPSDGPVQRNIYDFSLPSASIPAGGVQWYISAALSCGEGACSFSGPSALLPSPGATIQGSGLTILFPPTAPAVPQTVVIV